MDNSTTALVTVIDVTYITTGENGQADFIGLWYRDERKAHLLLFPLSRTDILALEEGDKGTLAHKGSAWEFTPRGN